MLSELSLRAMNYRQNDANKVSYYKEAFLVLYERL